MADSQSTKSLPTVTPGARFGRLLVRELDRTRPPTCWWCQCDCGTVISCRTGNLRKGTSRSCGCLARESARSVGQRNRKHGDAQARRPEYIAWGSLKARCTNPNTRGYRNYGGRGITVSAEWMNSYEAFLRDMGPRPSAEHSIDRIDNNGPYTGPCPEYPNGNCRWATIVEQNRNKRTNRS